MKPTITKTIYFVRHGESDDNYGSTYSGDEAVLSANGVRQAEFVASRLDKLPIEVILASPLNRARQTAEIINDVLRKPIEFTELLKEVKKPTDLIGKNLESDEAQKIISQYDLHKNEPDWKYSDEESFNERKNRLIQFVQQLISQERKNILVVSHGGVIRLIMAYMLFGKEMMPEETYRFMNFLRLDNTGVTVCHLWGKDSWSLANWNDLAHLGDN
ncbi:histidine phosphatase family protein [Patescibacteria group bacterium]|nr:histidine phosphatase family protein [Patescibacteria group bacterium]